MHSDLDRIPSAGWGSLALKAKFQPIVLARRCEISLRQLERYFLLVFHRPPKQWLHALRMSIAVQMITQHKAEKEVASLLGFSNIPHLIREFKRYFGCTPKQYLGIECSRSIMHPALPAEWSLSQEEARHALLSSRDEYALFSEHRARMREIRNRGMASNELPSKSFMNHDQHEDRSHQPRMQ